MPTSLRGKAPWSKAGSWQPLKLIQAQWPGMWEHFCEALFPGLLAFKAQINARGNHELSSDEDDMRIQAHVDYHLCQCLLQDSALFPLGLP